MIQKPIFDMKRLIILKVDYECGTKCRAAAFKQFRNDIKKIASIHILKEMEPKPQVIIEFSDDDYQNVYDNLRSLDIVEIIDSIIPENFLKLSATP
jgi:hypothetical protein